MKTASLLAALLVLVAVCVPVPAHAAGAWIAGGSSGEGRSLALGVRGPRWGLEVGFVRDYDYVQDQVFAFALPHPDYTVLGTKRIDPAWGFDGLRFAPLSERVSVYAGLGAYMRKRALVVESNVTGLRYEQSAHTSVTAAAQVGVQMTLGANVLLGAAYHSVRGPTVQFGAHW